MARSLIRFKKTILIFLLMASLYVYHQIGGQNESRTGRYQDTTRTRLPSGATGRDDADDRRKENTDGSDEAEPELLAKSSQVKDVTRNRQLRNKDGNIPKIDARRANIWGKQFNRYWNERKEGRNQKRDPKGETHDRKTQGKKSRDGKMDNSSEVLEKRRHLPRFGELNTRKVKAGKSRESQQKTGNIENRVPNKSFCNITFEYGQMCPTLYTDLGGYCRMDKTGFDCPDIRQKGYNELRSTQLVLTRLLKIFDLVAKKHGIKYWITSGTLLGAARHRGFIPWDEDGDIAMTMKEYVKLFKCCKNEFPEGTFFQNSETDPYLKPTDETKNRLLRHPVVGLYRRVWNPRLRDTKSCTKYCLEYGCKWADGLMIDIFIAEDTMEQEHLSRVFPLKEMMFEGFRFPVPANWREILEYLYGDYEKELGGENDRIPEDFSDPFHSCEQLKKARNS